MHISDVLDPPLAVHARLLSAYFTLFMLHMLQEPLNTVYMYIIIKMCLMCGDRVKAK